MATTDDDKRRRRLHWFFTQVIEGKDNVLTPDRAKRFLEAIRSKTDAVSCISCVISASHGVSALQTAMRVDVSSAFFSEPVRLFLQYLQNPEVAAACGGDLFRRILLCLTEPPIFWNHFLQHVENNTLSLDTLHCFAWMLLQLVSIPSQDVTPFLEAASRPSIQHVLQSAPKSEIRNIYQKITHIASTLTKSNATEANGPGGRHDNDFENFRLVSLLPTVDELVATEPPYLRFASETEDVDDDKKLGAQLDNQFRLLREDMLRDLKEEWNGRTKGRGQRIEGLRLVSIECDNKNKWALILECTNGLTFLSHKSKPERLRYLQEHKKILSHGSLACIIADGTFVGFGSIWRREDEMSEDVPRLYIQLPDTFIASNHTLSGIRDCQQLQLLQLNVALFSYEPILKQLQNTRLLPLADRMLTWRPGQATLQTRRSSALEAAIDRLKPNPTADLMPLLDLPRPAHLDHSQAQSLITGLTQELALIQGPPGTGKSFIGALVAKALYGLTKCKILVLSYTNHALDQYLEDLTGVGIPQSDIVRLGSRHKASDKTKSMVLSEQMSPRYRLSRDDWTLIDSYRSTAASAGSSLISAFDNFKQPSATKDDLLEYLEFSNEYQEYYDAFQVPDQEGEFQVVDEKGKPVDQFYLLARWLRGKDAGVFAEHASTYWKIWQISSSDREVLRRKWLDYIMAERLRVVLEYGLQYNSAISDVDTVHGERGRRLLHDKRVIGCTTTAAAKYVKDIQSACPDVVIVEEAGEILESHILAALGAETKQLVLIGDHKQLRPKAHYHLSVEKGTGYDLNRSLFERLVIKGYPHQILSQQHRMRPEIAALVRSLTYPDLTDAQSTMRRSPMKGFSNNVIFVNHTTAENVIKDTWDPRDGGATSTKTNDFEADMTLKCVKYLAQQGYGSDQIVVLTPYLGQLRLLYDVLKSENDPVLNDMDSYDLVKAGLMPQATAQMNRRRLRISTIDNYQGEESDIVVVSLTRSNDQGEIGFLSSPERLNVVVSRARDGLIMIGNTTTFLQAKKGKELWRAFLTLLKKGSHIYEGFPVQCERHPSRRAIVANTDDFDKICPDGGCDTPCDAILCCGKHRCPQKCHQLYDHSKMECHHVSVDACANGHKLSWQCYQGRPAVCVACEDKRRRDELKQEKEHKQRQARLQAEFAHDTQLAMLDEKIEVERARVQEMRLAEDRERVYEQKKLDLQNARKLADAATKFEPLTGSSSKYSSKLSTTIRQTVATTSPQQTQSLTMPQAFTSQAAEEWKHMQSVGRLSSVSLDKLMDMTGLEAVKTQFLNVLQKLQTVQRQGTDISHERLGTVFLGNPGTGKTTVARLYAEFLVEVGAIPGSKFVETTGSKLANEGVNGVKKMLDDIVQTGGGAVFVDEAYQLVSGNSFGGSSILDFLLAEIENTTGKVIFMFAGYEQQMEKFFQHNPGLVSRMPYNFKFADYDETELLHMLQQKIHKRYKGRMQVEDGLSGLYMRIAIRRLARGRGKEGFGNARALENMLQKITDSQSRRLARARKQGAKPDDFHMSKEDLIGLEPRGALLQCSAWQKLQDMVGLESVKSTVQTLLERLGQNYDRELKELPPIEVSLNRLFLGSPGTGKTTVAKLYGQILADLGLLSTSECVLKTPADFIGSVMGESEKNTKAILDSTKGKVLVLDEAYMLCSNLGSGPTGHADPYRTAVIDTIVSEVQSTPGEDRAVLLLGYSQQMEEMLRKVNPGLSRRFPVAGAFVFEDYNDADLLAILDHKLKNQGIEASDEAKQTAITVLAKLRRRPNFGNAGEVENLLSRAKDAFSQRQHVLPAARTSANVFLDPQDFDPDHGRSANALENISALFKDVVGNEGVIGKLEGYAQTYNNALKRGMNPEELIPFNFIFKGPPGTGKTTTARKIGTVFYEMGFLASDEVVDCSATDLVGQYVGQTGPKVIQKFDQCLGKVLFIDEAYRLGEGPFTKEAVDELVDCLTKPQYQSKMIVILAGYEHEVNRLIAVNPGLSSRFPEEIVFENLGADLCLQLLEEKLRKRFEATTSVKIELKIESEVVLVAKQLLEELFMMPGWGNGRDIDTIAKRVAENALKTALASDENIVISWARVIAQLRRLHEERRARNINTPTSEHAEHILTRQAIQQQSHLPPTPQTLTSATKATVQAKELCPHIDEEDGGASVSAQRDAGVLDAVWQQLQTDKVAQDRTEQEQNATLAFTKKEHDLLLHKVQEAEKEEAELKEKVSQDNEARRRHEEMRMQAIKAKRAADEQARKMQEIMEEKKQEQKVQQKLQQMGVCCAGYRWIKQADGYRCAGGSHYVGNSALGI